MDDKIVMTQEGLDELKAELENRLSEIREKIANDIEIARQQGDLSENAAYKAAMESKEFNETRIGELQNLVKRAEVKGKVTGNNKIDLSERFTLKNEKDGKEVTYTLVGANEADPREGKISLESPIGEAVLGKDFGDSVEINLPAGITRFKILKP